jgi:polyisoprenoid-binding protein YceI
VIGVFREVSGNGTVSPEGAVSGTVTVAAVSIDTRNTRRGAHLRSADFFDSGDHPDITFTADGIRPSGRGVTVSGVLTVRGRTRPLSFDAAAWAQGDGEIEEYPAWGRLSYGSCSSLSRRLVGVGVPALVGLLGVVLVAPAP